MRHAPFLRLAFAAALGLALGAQHARAGGSDIESSADEKEHGASYFGEAKDVNGLKPLEGVRVTAQRKGTPLPVIAATDEEGRFRIQGFGKEVNSDDVVVACAKAGWKLVDLTRRKMAKDADAPVEVECLMEKG